MSECPPRVKLLQLLSDGEHVQHLRECAACSKFASAAMEAVNVFSNREEMERALSDRLDELLADTYGHRMTSAVSNATDMHRSIVVRELIRRAGECRGSNPSRYLDLAMSAVVVCDRMDDAGCPPEPELRVEALKEKAAALRQLGALDDAMAALARADALLPLTRTPEFHRAILTLHVALIDVEPDRGNFDEAIALAESASATLDLSGDDRRATLARQTKAYALMLKGDLTAALTMLRNVVAELDAAATAWAAPHDIAVAYGSLAYCLVGLGSYYEAERMAALAVRIHEECGATAHAARAAHIRACALAGLDAFDEAEPEFNRTAEIVFDAKLYEEWCVMRLDYAAAALSVNPAADVRAELISVARISMTLMENQETARRRYAAEALAFLRQLATQNAVSYEAIDYVRRYVRQNATRPPAKFSPPRGGAFLM
jgi:tetratricopeptide (TPR) repeat protein